MEYKLISLKYSIIAFIAALIPYTILLAIMKTFKSFTILHLSTVIVLALLTASINSIYIYLSINKRIQNKNQQ
jgi:hypothetical protein